MEQKDAERFQSMLLAMYKTGRADNYKKEEFQDGSSAWVDFAKIKILSTPPPTFGTQPCVVVRPSRVHGLGLFATRDISENVLVSFYPGDIVEYYPDRNRTSQHRKLIQCSDRASPHMRCEDPDSKLHALQAYALTVNDYITITGHPACLSDVWNAGHFVNDRFKPDNNKISNEIYLELSKKRANCKYHTFAKDLHVGIITTRKIQKDEELFATYGIAYWATDH